MRINNVSQTTGILLLTQRIRGKSVARLPICVLLTTLAVVSLMLGLATETWAAFTGGPSVRVSPNTKVEFRWNANFVGEGKVEIFDNPNGGVPIAIGTSSVSGAGHTIEIGVGGVLQADRTYFFRVIHRDPTNVRPDLTNDPAPYPRFFTGAQAISNVHVESITTNSAVISWEGNVIGPGSVMYGTTALDQGPVEDSFNVTNHSIELTGLSPGTTYQLRVSTSTRSTAPAWPRRRDSSRRRTPSRLKARPGGGSSLCTKSSRTFLRYGNRQRTSLKLRVYDFPSTVIRTT